MAFPEDQISYLNATIVNFRGQLGWGDSPSSLTITLVEDDSIGQVFLEPSVGTPTYFDYNGWVFGGIFQSWTRNRNQGGLTYDVIINDPRMILQGCQVILGSYTGMTFGLPNIYNVYGYLETQSFGSSGYSASRGINGRLALNTLQSLMNTTPISYRGNTYYVDLRNLISICGAEYRININDKASLYEIISTVASDAVSDFFIRLESRNGQHWICPYFVSRANPPVFDAIRNFINTTEVTYGTVSNTVGRELVSEPTSKMIIGGKVCVSYYTSQNIDHKWLYGKKDDNTYYFNLETCMLDVPFFYFDLASKFVQPDTTDSYIDWRDRIRRYAQAKAEEANIWPYWGHDARGNLVIGYGPPNSLYYEDSFGNIRLKNNQIAGNHKMIIDGRKIDQALLPFYGASQPHLVDYLTDTGELAAALEGFDEWLQYILLTSAMINHHNRFYKIENGFNPLFMQQVPNLFGMRQPRKYYSKAEMLGLNVFANFATFSNTIDMGVSQLINDTLQLINNNGNSANARFNNAAVFNSVTVFLNNINNIKNNSIRNAPNLLTVQFLDALNLVYQDIHAFASKHLGKTFMVRVPNMQAKRDADTGEIVYSYKPTSGGFFEEAAWPTAIQNNLMPSDTNRILDADGKIKSYVRFSNNTVTFPPNGLVVGELNPTVIGLDNIISKSNTLNPNNPYDDYYYVLCNVEEQPVFLNNSTLDSPRMVIELPNPMVLRLHKNYYHIAELYRHVVMGLGIMQGNFEFFEAAAWSAISKIVSVPGNDGWINSVLGSPFVMPDLAVIALESETERYGPWLIEGANGATDFEIVEELVPWAYGSYTTLNTVANAKLAQAAANRQEVEHGTIEFPGAPTFLLGDAMVANGPVITSIQVNIDPKQGVTTSYNLSTWTPQFGHLSKAYSDKLANLHLIQRDAKIALRDIARARNINQSNIKFTAGAGRGARPSRSRSIHSSMVVMGAATQHAIDSSGNPVYYSRGAFMPGYYLENQSYDEYPAKAFASVDTLIRPFTTETTPGSSGMPHFESPTNGASSPTVNDLNPYAGNYDFDIVSHDVNVDTTNETNIFENYGLTSVNHTPSPSSVKSISLRGPLVITGWGYDVNGNCVPRSSGDATKFWDNHRQRQDLWKTGPVDLRWDDDAKIWTPGGNGLYLGITKQNIYGRGSGLVDIYNLSDYPTLTVGNSGVMVYDYLLKQGDTLYANSRVILTKIANKYFIVNAECPSC